MQLFKFMEHNFLCFNNVNFGGLQICHAGGINLDEYCMCYFVSDTYPMFFLMFELQEARKYAEENSLFFMETSAKTAINVNDIFYEIGMVLNFNFFPKMGK